MEVENLPKVSIITTTFNLYSDNRQDLFVKCCESIHNQTYPNIEHIVEDNASTDGSLKLIKEYAQKKWLKCYSEKDNGIDDGYNKALSHVSGKYVFFLNSDDSYYADDVIEKCVEKMEAENADYCYGYEKQYTRDGEYIYSVKPNMAQFWHNVPYTHATMGIKKDVLAKLGNYHTDCGYGGDYYLMIQLILNDYKGIEIPIIISKYTLGGVSSQVVDKAKQYRTYFILAKRLQFLYQQFMPEITLEECFDIYMFANVTSRVYPKHFLLKLVRFMLDKNLKNFDYTSFINYVNKLSEAHVISSPVSFEVKYYKLFNFIPLMKTKIKGNTKKLYLFDFIPLLKIKEK